MGKLADMIASYVDRAIKAMPIMTAVGTVATSPSQVSTDAMTVVIDGSATAVPVKLTRGLPLSQGARVVLVRFGSEWTIVGSLTNPSVGTNSSRMVIGADTPAELRSYGIDTAILSYINDVTSGLEVGYFFIGTSNRFDGGGNNRVQAFGNVVYPTPGVPSSATVSNVKTNFQQDMFTPFPQTIFKDQTVELWTNFNLRWDTGFRLFTVDGHVMGHGLIDEAADANPTGAIAAETTIFTVPSSVYRTGRAFRVIVDGHFNFSAANGLGRIKVYRNSTAGTLLATCFFGCGAGAAGGPPGDYKHFEPVFRNNSGSDVTDTIVVTLACFTAGTVSMFSAADTIRRVEIRDTGAAADFALTQQM